MKRKHVNSKTVYACLTCRREGDQLKSTGRTKSGNLRSPRFVCEPGHKVQKFDSKGEFGRYRILRTAEVLGEIKNLELQPAFDLMVNGKKIATVKYDFSYFKDNERVVEDWKGYFNIKDTDKGTRLWRYQAAHVEADYGVKVRVVTK